jgi:hypothetical protein
VLTIKPDNTGALKTLTTAQVVELINTGAVVAQPDITLSDTGGLRALQTATGAGTTPILDTGNLDHITATFSGGTYVPVTVTTANLVELINTGLITGKTPTITDGSSLRALQTATGGDTTVLAASGEGDGYSAVFSGGSLTVVNLTTAELSELLRTGSVVGKILS